MTAAAVGRRARRPVVLRPLARLTGRDAVWAVIREIAASPRPEFTRRDLRRRIAAGYDLMQEYVRQLTAAGILAEVSPASPVAPAVYRLARDCGVEPPRIARDGTLDTTPSDQERLWQAMKALPAFCVSDLQASTGLAQLASVRAYVKHLHRAGYLALIDAGNPRRQARYRLLGSRNTGPRPPAIRRGKIVFDLNEGRQVWPAVAS